MSIAHNQALGNAATALQQAYLQAEAVQAQIEALDGKLQGAMAGTTGLMTAAGILCDQLIDTVSKGSEEARDAMHIEEVFPGQVKPVAPNPVLESASTDRALTTARFDLIGQALGQIDDLAGAHHLPRVSALANALIACTDYANFSYSTANRAGRLALSDTMMRSIGAFARTGDPNNAGLGVTWPTWPSTLVFNATLTNKAISVLP